MKAEKSNIEGAAMLWRKQHHDSLSAIHPGKEDGLKIWRKLRRVEVDAHRAAENHCNGLYSEEEWSAIVEDITQRVARVFGGEVPAGFFFNTDPRGLALKLEEENTPEGMTTDWGRYGLLAWHDGE